MRLEDVTARIRPRGNWESVDLGFALARRQFRQLLVAWCLTVVPLWVLLLAASHWVPLGWVLVVIWWLKPFYSRVPLFILSRSLFGAKPTLRETLRAWPRLLTSRFFGIILTRVPWLIAMPSFAWNRALLLPVMDLEGQRGNGYKTRQTILLQQAGGTSSGLTLLCGSYQLVLVFAFMALGAMFSWNPVEGSGILDTLNEAMTWDVELSNAFVWSLIVCYLVSLTLVEIFYVGGGFGLYLNCRTALEGWDVELSFRQLAQRVAKVAVVILALAFLVPTAAHAQDLEKPTETVLTEDQQKIKTVKEHEDFKIHFEEHQVSQPGKSSPNLSISPGWAEFFFYAGWVAFYLVIGALLFLVGWLIYKNRHIFDRRLAGDAPNVPRTLMGMEITPESLPSDILAAARAAWLAGDARTALSLLYRGSLLWLVQTARLPIRESDTEGDCLRHSLTIPEPPEREYFGELTNQWIHAAYATHLPEPEVMERLLSTWPYQMVGRARA